MDNSPRRARIGFYTTSDTIVSDTSFFEISINGIGSDSIFYDAAQSISEVLLPLSPASDSCAFVFNITTRDIYLMYIDTTDGVYDTAYISSELDTIHITIPYDTLDTDYLDVFTIYYQRSPVITHDCGVIMNYEIYGASYLKDNIIDTVVIVYPEIISDELENIKIYY